MFLVKFSDFYFVLVGTKQLHHEKHTVMVLKALVQILVEETVQEGTTTTWEEDHQWDLRDLEGGDKQDSIILFPFFFESSNVLDDHSPWQLATPLLQ